MRVIGGAWRSRRLSGPPEGVRPTSDRVRESLFARLGDVTGARVLDLFAGTGALAIEALSRGAERAVLVDRAAASLEVLRRNLLALDVGDRAEVVGGDALRLIPRLGERGPFDLVFLDPPYAWDGLAELLVRIVSHDLLAPDALVVVEGAKRHSLAPPAGLSLEDERVYGDTRVTWLRRDETTGNNPDEPDRAAAREPRA